jgi:hypothetical protein
MRINYEHGGVQPWSCHDSQSARSELWNDLSKADLHANPSLCATDNLSYDSPHLPLSHFPPTTNLGYNKPCDTKYKRDNRPRHKNLQIKLKVP